MLYSTLSRSQYDYSLPQVSFTSTGYHKHVTLTFNPTVRFSSLFYLFIFFHFRLFVLKQTKKTVSMLCFRQRKLPDQDVAQGSYIALPLTLLLLLAAYNHEKVPVHTNLTFTFLKRYFATTSLTT